MSALISPTEAAVRPFLRNRSVRNRVSELDRARLAAWYVVEVESDNRNPARTLADRYPETSYKTWANIFSSARSQEPALLTDAPRRGVAGGTLTEHAERLLRRGPGFTIPPELMDAYEATRETYSAPVRRERRTMFPVLSKFPTVAEYDKAFENYMDRQVWWVDVRTGQDTYEDPDDWLDRMLRDEDED